MWTCPRCTTINVGLNKQCVICLKQAGVFTTRINNEYDEFDSLVIRCEIYRLDQILWKVKGYNMSEYEDKLKKHQELIENGTFQPRPMTMQEELHSKLFFHHKFLVKDMDDLQMEAYREEASKIAFEARVILTVVDDEKKERNKKRKTFQVSDVEDITSEAINKINERQRKLNKDEREIDALEKFGLTKAQAEYIGKDMFNALLKANKDIENLVKIKIDRKTAEGMYAPVIKPIMDKLEAFKDKSTIKKEAIIISGKICPECDSKLEVSEKFSGNLLCPECKTLLCIAKVEKPVLSNKPFIELTEVKPSAEQSIEQVVEVIQQPKAKNPLNPFEK